MVAHILPAASSLAIAATKYCKDPDSIYIHPCGQLGGLLDWRTGDLLSFEQFNNTDVTGFDGPVAGSACFAIDTHHGHSVWCRDASTGKWVDTCPTEGIIAAPRYSYRDAASGYMYWENPIAFHESQITLWQNEVLPTGCRSGMTISLIAPPAAKSRCHRYYDDADCYLDVAGFSGSGNGTVVGRWQYFYEPDYKRTYTAGTFDIDARTNHVTYRTARVGKVLPNWNSMVSAYNAADNGWYFLSMTPYGDGFENATKRNQQLTITRVDHTDMKVKTFRPQMAPEEWQGDSKSPTGAIMQDGTMHVQFTSQTQTDPFGRAIPWSGVVSFDVKTGKIIATSVISFPIDDSKEAGVWSLDFITNSQ